jgi:hypothetical protein
LIRDDFPTFDLPMKAYSGMTGFGHWLKSGLLVINLEIIGDPNFFIPFCKWQYAGQF